MIKTAADVSNWSHIPTDADIAALKALGVTRVTVGTSFSHQNGDGTYTYIGEAQCQAFEAAGFEVQEYQFIGHHKATTRVWWLDVELAETKDDVRVAVATTSPTGIYTRRGIWETLDYDIVAEFPGLKLWDANYGPLPRTFIPYGGWTKADMTQYHDTMDIGTGLEVDLSYYEEEDEMTAEEKAQFEQMAATVKDLQKIAWDQGVRLNALDTHVHNQDLHTGAFTSGPVQPS